MLPVCSQQACDREDLDPVFSPTAWHVWVTRHAETHAQTFSKHRLGPTVLQGEDANLNSATPGIENKLVDLEKKDQR